MPALSSLWRRSPTTTGTSPPSKIDLPSELNDQLTVVTAASGSKSRKLLQSKDVNKPYLPGQPRIRLNGTSQNVVDPGLDEVLAYLRKNHLTEALDELLPYMRYFFVQTPAFNHIFPLHHQKAHAREIMVNEKPGLHLVWYYERIFVKPIPAYFLSQAFWDYIQEAEADVYRAGVGFMRSYYCLIQYELDFDLAVKLRLIPKLSSTNEFPTYEEWCAFIEPFRHVDEATVNRRYHYGELRLTRINRTAMFFKFSLAYFHIFPQWGSFLAHMLTPIVTIFAMCSIILNSMQVTLAAIDMGEYDDSKGWPSFVNVSIYFPIAVILLIGTVLGAALIGIVFMGYKDFTKGNKVRDAKKKGDWSVGEKSHGMV
ncbi:hypothetical protein B0H63DRAFT_3006 [Podospora didyma]|uniref:Uncharacterized protein n=1 Tax=Podospora didyma TaxID=330526 RepID=A0AAE0P3Y6_9PEZI|nr:hypothetical protein B0H63DRAFT_3006 [Podospora didyma]